MWQLQRSSVINIINQQYFVIIRRMDSNQEQLVDKSNFNEESNLASKKRRRTRKEENGRNFPCSCGKSYLSYSALYTHNKVKHDRKIQFEKALLAISPPEDEEKQNFLDEETIQVLENQESPYDFIAFKLFIKKTRLYLERQYNLRELLKLERDGLQSGEKMKKYWLSHQKEDCNFDGDIYFCTINHAFGLFLRESENYLTDQELQLLTLFIMRIVLGINQREGNNHYCAVEGASQIPNFMNDIFTLKFSSEDDVFGSNSSLVCMLIYHLSKWLLKSRFTTLNLQLNLS